MATTPIRFSVQATVESDGGAWRDLAKRVEGSGFDALHVPDHLGATSSPFAALAAAASVTSTLRLGTYVLNAGIREPLEIASDAATVDVLSDGRMILGLGAGHTPAEWTMTGQSHPTAGERVGRLAETAGVVRALLSGERVTHHGRFVHVDEAFLHAPRPVQAVMPLLIGGNGPQVLALAGRTADIVSLTGLGRTLEDGHTHEVEWSVGAIDASVEGVHAAAPARTEEIVLDALVQHLEITERRSDTAEKLARRVGGPSAPDVLESPYILLGTVEQLLDELQEHRERWGFTSYVVRADALDAAAALIERLPPS